MEKDSKIWVAGRNTLIGAALLRLLKKEGYKNILDFKPDLFEPRQIQDFFSGVRPEYVFVAAGKSAGIKANMDQPADLMLDNLLSGIQLIHNAHQFGVRKLLYLGSSCCYPKHSPQPMKVESLMTGPLESTSQAYATAKLACMKLCEAYRKQYDDSFIVGIPADAFGPGDDYLPENSHVVAAVLSKMHDAMSRGSSSVTFWGTGKPRREFLFVDDLADACIFVMENYDDPLPINLGGGTDQSIMELAEVLRDLIGYSGEIIFDAKHPDGMPFKTLDSQILLNMGWKPRTSFREALQETYNEFLKMQVEHSDVR